MTTREPLWDVRESGGKGRQETPQSFCTHQLFSFYFFFQPKHLPFFLSLFEIKINLVRTPLQMKRQGSVVGSIPAGRPGDLDDKDQLIANAIQVRVHNPPPPFPFNQFIFIFILFKINSYYVSSSLCLVFSVR
jgi:hypothetical protein